MSEAEDPGRILVVGPDVPLRHALCEALAAWRVAVDLTPGELARAPHRETPAAFALLAIDERPALDELCAALESVPAGRATCLVAGEVSDELLAEAVVRLRPRQILGSAWRAPALRFVLEQIDPHQGRVASARRQHRPAHLLLGVSAGIREMLEQVRQVAPTDAPVLVLGETGTGKELVAHAIHEQSRRLDGPFVVINCAAIPDQLLEAELFGFRRGAFTGAESGKRGLIEEADGGTLFLDEVAEIPLPLQAKLLRVLEAGEVRPLGSTETRIVNVRLVSATHQDLESLVDQERFRQDLFYRLNTVALYVPPLRRRKVDIPFLAQHFAEEFGSLHARRITLGEEFVDGLARYDFPGNVRELRNAVERAIALANPGDELTDQNLPAEVRRIPAFLPVGTLRDRVMQVEVQAIREALERFDGNRTRVAEALGISRLGLRQKMRRLGLEDPVRS